LPAENYEIRLLGPDGKTALLFMTRCISDAHAREVALKIFSLEYTGYEIWRGQLFIEKYSR
jgi:hypothetical protein